jgi:hypothetical protein
MDGLEKRNFRFPATGETELSRQTDTDNCAEKCASSAEFERLFAGRKPSIIINLAPDTLAKCSINVDLPIRRRPRQVTNDEVRLPHKRFKSAICSYHP